MTFALALASFTGPASAATSTKLLDADWISVRTPHFSILSSVDEKNTTELARELELFRQLVLKQTRAKSDETSIPMQIILFQRRSDLQKVGIEDRDTAGLFLPGLRDNVILLTRDRKFDRLFIQHEYVHFLVNTATRRHFPRWVSEGYAEFLGATKTKKDSLTYGDVPKLRLDWLKHHTWIPFRKIIDRREVATLNSNENAMLYAQSWLLMHYLQLGRPGRVFSDDLGSYLAGLRRGTPDLLAFESGFELDVDDLDGLLINYVNRRKLVIYGFPLDDFELPIPVETRPSTPHATALTLARAMIELGSDDLALPYVERAIEIDPESSRAWAARSVSLDAQGLHDEATTAIGRAMKLTPDDPYVLIDAGNHWLIRAQAEDTTEKLRAKWLSRSRRLYVRAAQIDKSIPEIFAMYGRNILADGRQAEKAVEILEEAERLLPSHYGIRSDLARAYQLTGDGAAALDRASSVLMSGHASGRAREQASEIVLALAESCDEEATNDLHFALVSDIHRAYNEASNTSEGGKLTLTLQLSPSGDIETLATDDTSSDEYAAAVLEATRSAHPFDSLTPGLLTCFSGQTLRIPLKFDAPADCEDEESLGYRQRIQGAIYSAVNDAERMAQPGSGHVRATFKLTEEGIVDQLKLSVPADAPLGAKLQQAIAESSPFGPPPDFQQCWQGPIVIGFAVEGSDTTEGDQAPNASPPTSR